MKLSLSILSADFSKLGQVISFAESAGIELLHVDVMDGNFVSSITIGECVVSSLRDKTGLIFDVHLMTTSPEARVASFAHAGADIIVFHAEATSDPAGVISAIKAGGKKAGMAISPGTDAGAVLPYLKELDQVLVMTVVPGKGGQAFMMDMLPKIAAIKAEIDRLGLSVMLQVDGGINPQTIGLAAEAGANSFVIGSSVFHNENPAQAVREIRAAAMTL